MSHFHKLLHLSLAAALLGIQGAQPLRAQAPAAKAPEKPRQVVRQETVYVPYEKLKEIFEKEGRGIFLPYEEFLRLWHAAQPKPPEPPPDEPPAPAVIRGGSYTGSVSGEVVRFDVTYEMDALKDGWSELELPLKGVALESVELSSPQALFSAQGDSYRVLFPSPGHYQAKLRFSVRVGQQPGRKTISFGVPPIAVSRLELTIPEEDVRVDVQPMLAVTQTSTEQATTKVLAFLGNSSNLSIHWMPPAGKLTEGGAVLLAEQAIQTYLGERILRIATDIDYRILRGEVDTLTVEVPAETRLLSVKGDNIREWLQEDEKLVVKLHSPLKNEAGSGDADGNASYRLSLSFERILPETPPTLSVPFSRVEGVIRESGWVVFRYESGLNVRVQSTSGLSQLDRDEVPEPLRKQLGIGFRYLAHPIELALEVEKITPVIKSFTTSVVSLGPEEDTWVGWVDYDITKAGVFRLQLRVPSRWTVASVGEETTVEDFQTEDDGAGVLTITVSLRSKALGNFRLPLKLTAQGTSTTDEATLSPPVVVDSQQDRGLFGINAPKSVNLNTVEQSNMISADVDELFRSGIMNQIGADTGMPLTYRYREPGGSVRVSLEPKKTEIDVLAQHLIEITDSSVKSTHILDYQILYAAVDKLQFTAPAGLDDVLKVEAKEKKQVSRSPGEQGRTLWEVTLQAPALGPVSLTITHEEELKAGAAGESFPYTVQIIQSSGVRQEIGFIALRKEGTLEIVPQPTGMEAIDAVDLPDKLRRGQIYGAFRYFSPNPALTLNLTRYEYQELATTVVNLLHMKSVLSEDRLLKTRATLAVQNTERQYLEVRLGSEAKIHTISVAGKGQNPRQREAEERSYLIQIPASAAPSGTFLVVIVYDEPLDEDPMSSFGSVELETPEVLDGVPVTKVEVDLFLAPEYAYLGWGGSLNARFLSKWGLWSRFKKLVNDSLGAQNAETPVQAPRQQGDAERPAGEGTALDLEIPTRGYVQHEFETLASVGTLSFFFVDRTLFSFLDFLAFLVALGAGFFLLKRVGWPKSVTAVVFVFIPLALVWFAQGAVVEIFTSFLTGGLLLFLIIVVTVLGKKLGAYRARKLALAPDPYLEEVEESVRKEDEQSTVGGSPDEMDTKHIPPGQAESGEAPPAGTEDAAESGDETPDEKKGQEPPPAGEPPTS